MCFPSATFVCDSVEPFFICVDIPCPLLTCARLCDVLVRWCLCWERPQKRPKSRGKMACQLCGGETQWKWMDMTNCLLEWILHVLNLLAWWWPAQLADGCGNRTFHIKVVRFMSFIVSLLRNMERSACNSTLGKLSTSLLHYDAHSIFSPLLHSVSHRTIFVGLADFPISLTHHPTGDREDVDHTLP